MYHGICALLSGLVLVIIGGELPMDFVDAAANGVAGGLPSVPSRLGRGGRTLVESLFELFAEDVAWLWQLGGFASVSSQTIRMALRGRDAADPWVTGGWPTPRPSADDTLRGSFLRRAPLGYSLAIPKGWREQVLRLSDPLPAHDG
jgi:hypothetical protein